HLGYELFPRKFVRHGLFKWSNTSTHHNMHHRLVKCNYGLYFNFWDRILGTNHADYEKHFEEVVDGREKS
ncbi:MAG: sterol desaturase family protein, partial [Bacteroidia bacterium]